LFAADRFGLDIRTSDFERDTLPLSVFLAADGRQIDHAVCASATHEGFYNLSVPIGMAKFDVGVPLGMLGKIVQIEQVSFFTVSGLQAYGGPATRPIAADPVYEAVEYLEEGLYRCNGNSLLFVSPPEGAYSEPLMLSVVFRPVVSSAPFSDNLVSQAA
jgi:hypothetical protein